MNTQGRAGFQSQLVRKLNNVEKLFHLFTSGHTGTQVAACSFHKGKLTMLSSSSCAVGGRYFDEAICNFFIQDFATRFRLWNLHVHELYVITKMNYLQCQFTKFSFSEMKIFPLNWHFFFIVIQNLNPTTKLLLNFLPKIRYFPYRFQKDNIISQFDHSCSPGTSLT